jgi:small-conductance mechanosensitive channel
VSRAPTVACHAPAPLVDLAVETSQWTGAAAALAVAIVLAFLVERAFSRRGRRLAEVVARGELSRETDTRLRFVRRLITATILLVGVALALSQFAGINRVAASVLASGVVAAAIVGFAARQTLANVVAGVMLAVTQPIRVGDWVTYEGLYGQVDDVRLNYTVLRTAGQRRVLIPNEKLASGVLVNDTLVVDDVSLEVAVWIPPDADTARALELLRAEVGTEVTIAESAPTGIKLAVSGDPVPAADKADREADLRARCLARLHAEGLLEGFPPPTRS